MPVGQNYLEAAPPIQTRYPLFCFITAYAYFSFWHLCGAKFLNNAPWFCIAKCHTHCRPVKEARKQMLLLVFGLWRRTDHQGLPQRNTLKLALTKAITQSTCPFASISAQMRIWPNTPLVLISLGVGVYQQRAALEGDRGRQGVHLLNACLNAIFISLRSLARKIYGRKLRQTNW